MTRVFTLFIFLTVGRLTAQQTTVVNYYLDEYSGYLPALFTNDPISKETFIRFRAKIDSAYDVNKDINIWQFKFCLAKLYLQADSCHLGLKKIREIDLDSLSFNRIVRLGGCDYDCELNAMFSFIYLNQFLFKESALAIYKEHDNFEFFYDLLKEYINSDSNRADRIRLEIYLSWNEMDEWTQKFYKKILIKKGAAK